MKKLNVPKGEMKRTFRNRTSILKHKTVTMQFCGMSPNQLNRQAKLV